MEMNPGLTVAAVAAEVTSQLVGVHYWGVEINPVHVHQAQ